MPSRCAPDSSWRSRTDPCSRSSRAWCIEDDLTGFLFGAISVDACLEAIARAFNVFGNSDIFMTMRRLAMARNFSWAKPAASYQDIYGRAIDGFQARHVT